jgi:hypothetical protein
MRHIILGDVDNALSSVPVLCSAHIAYHKEPLRTVRGNSLFGSFGSLPDNLDCLVTGVT